MRLSRRARAANLCYVSRGHFDDNPGGTSVHRTLRPAATAAATLLIGSALLASPATASETGLSGVVIDDLGTPVSTCVQVYDTEGGWVDSACTDDTGAWSLPGLSDGSYKVFVQGVEYSAGEWFEDAVDFDTAIAVTLPAALSTTVSILGRLEGTLTGSQGMAVPSVSVSVTSTSGAEVAHTNTDFQGSWSVVVEPGEYKVHFSDYGVDQWAFGVDDEDAADTLTVARAQTTRADDTLLPVPAVRGTVTDDAGRPLENVCASLVNPESFSEYDAFGYACTDSEGRYRLVPYDESATSATVWFRDANDVPTHAAEFAGGSYDPALADRIDLSAGDVVVDSTLSVGGVITGKAVTERRPNGLADVCPDAYAGHSGSRIAGMGIVCSGADGVYHLTALPPGDVAVLLEPSWRSGASPEWYHDADSQATATLATSALGARTALKPNKFVPGGVVSGTITDALGRPVEGAWVYLEGRYPGRSGAGEGQFVAQTDAAGRYHLVAPAGSYTPLVAPTFESGLAPEWSGDAVTRATALPVLVRDYRTSTFDASLVPASKITGRVAMADGSAPPLDIYVAGLVFTSTGDYIGDIDAWESSGFRFFGGNLPAGTFRIQASVWNPATEESTIVWFDGAATEEGATLVPVDVGGSTEITFHLPEGYS